MNFDEYWAIGIQANPLLGSSDVLRAIAEAAWNAGAREEREACAKACDRQAWLQEETGADDCCIAEATRCARDIRMRSNA